MSSTDLSVSLSGFAPFDALSTQYLHKVAEHTEQVTLAKGKLIFQRGKISTHRYYLLSGDVDLLDSGFQATLVSAGSARARMTLDDRSPTHVSAVAKSAVTLLKVDAEFLDVAMAWSQASDAGSGSSSGSALDSTSAAPLGDVDLAMAQVEVTEDEGDWMSALLQSPLFLRVSPAHIQTLFSRFERQRVSQGQLVVKEGEAGDYFYVIESGTARVTNLTGKLDVSLQPGQFFGEEALVGDAPRNATITMTTDGCLMRLEKADFKSLLQEPVQRLVTQAQLPSLGAHQLLDVRLPLEYRHQHVAGCRNIPLASLRTKLGELDRDTVYVVTDDAGRRAQVAAYLLCQQGFEAVLLQGADQYY